MRFSKLVSILAFGLLATGVPAKPPNIVFIFSDDHAPHAIGAYDGWLKSVDPTPNIDRLAAQGMIFRKSYTANSICGPSRAVILTGKHSHKNGFMNNGNNFNGDQQTFPKLLQKAGYQTAMLGKWHLKSTPQGFDYWKVLPGQGDYYNPDLLTPEGKERVQGYCTDIVTDLAVDWIKNRRDKSKPFLMMAQHKAPHRNWMPAPRHLNLYDDIDIPEPATLFDTWEDNASPARWQELEIDRHMDLCFDLFVDPQDPNEDPMKRKGRFDRSAWRNRKKFTPEQERIWQEAYAEENKAFYAAKLTGKDLVRWKYQRYAKNYLRSVRGVDDSVGTLMKTLEDEGLADNTVVVYSSDQGFYIGDHGWYDKRWMYEESFMMPFIVKWPGVTKPGSESKHLIQNIDYAQTFLDMAGVAQPSDMQGRSLTGILKGEEPKAWRKSLYYHYYEYPSVHMVPRHIGIRTDRYKLIQFYQFGEWELYDLKSDPDELTNLYPNPEYAKLTKDLKGQLEGLRKFYDDPTDISEKPDAWKQQFRKKP